MNTSTFDDDVAAFERLLAEQLANIRHEQAERLARFDPQAQTWLALVPSWSAPLAEACRFPLGEAALHSFVEEAERAGLCAHSESMANGDGDSHVLSFWMPERARVETLRDLGNTEGGRHVLQRTAIEIGTRILSAREKVFVSEMVGSWAELAALAERDLNQCSQYLIDTIRQLVDKEADTGRAQMWLAASKILAHALGGSLETARRVGENCIEREYRRAQDERHLERFKPIPAQVEAFNQLLATPDDGKAWALHYLGRGGVGKTMLLRYITGRLLAQSKAEDGQPAPPPKPFSRIDFDYLSPEYPVRRPGQLLLELAAGLRPFIESEKQRIQFDEFQNRALELHESLSQKPPPGNPLANIRDERFEPMLNAFTGFLNLLPKPVVLILDTCEELAKVRSTGGILPTIEATFEILSRIHDAVPSVRVVFAGRRLLTQAGRNCLIPPDELTEEELSLPARKDFLLLHEIRGFTEQDAKEYMAENEGLTLDDKMRIALFANSLDSGGDARIHWKPSRPDSDEKYFNPFYLSLYAGWLKEDPALQAEDILTGKTDPYVEVRIINRIGDDTLRDALPAVVLLRRFDKDMLLPALKSPEQIDEVYRKLSAQEWMYYQWDEELQVNFLEVDRNLHGRLLEYYQQPARSHLLDAASRRLAAKLGELVRGRPLGQLTTDHVDAALRLLPEQEAAEVWADFELRVAREGNWHRAFKATERILGEEGAVKNKNHALRAAVLATHAAAFNHVNPGTSLLPGNPLRQIWEDVERAADAHPDAQIKRWLKLRAQAGNLTAIANAPTNNLDYFRFVVRTDTLTNDFLKILNEEARAAKDSEGDVDAAWRERGNHLTASFCAAFESVVERAERDIASGAVISDQMELKTIVERLERFINSEVFRGVSPDLSAYCYTLAGRYYRLLRILDDDSMFRRAIEIMEGADTGSPGQQRWLDWHAPASLLDRIVLESLRNARPVVDPALRENLEKRQLEAASRLEHLDAEVLCSFILKQQLAEGVVPAATLEEITKGEMYRPHRAPTCAAHTAAPPLVCALALGWLALGDANRALTILTKRIDEAGKTREDAPTVRAAEWTKLRVIRRMRLHSRGSDLVNRFVRSSDPAEVLGVRQLVALTRSFNPDALLQPGSDAPAALIHAWWQSQTTLTREMAGDAVEMMSNLYARRVIEASQNSGSLDIAKRLVLDWEETKLVAKKYKMAALLSSGEGVNLRIWAETILLYSEEEIRMVLRASALGDGPIQIPLHVMHVFGKRLVAEVALEEGEMLALRLPVHALPLLEYAVKLFDEIKDDVGATIASIRAYIARIHAYQWMNELAPFMMAEQVEIQKYYERVAEKDTTLPGWDELLTIGHDLTLEHTGKIGHLSWEGWLHRLLKLLTRAAKWDFKTSPRLVDRNIMLNVDVKAWLQSIYGQRAPVELAFSPSELAIEANTGRVMRYLSLLQRHWVKILVFVILGSAALSGWGLIENNLAPLDRESQQGYIWLLRGVYLAIVLAVYSVYIGWMVQKGNLTIVQAISLGFIGVVLVLLYVFLTLVIAITNWLSGGQAIVFALLAVLAGAGLAFWMVKGGWRWFRGQLETVHVVAANIRLQIRPVAIDSAQSGNLLSARPVQMGLVVDYSPSRMILPFGRPKESVNGSGEVSALVPYREAAQDVPLEIYNHLIKLKDRLRIRFSYTRVGLEVDPTLAFYPWEAVLTLTMPAKDVREVLSRVHFWRQEPPLATSGATKYANRVDVVNVNWALFAESAWSSLKARAAIIDDPRNIDKSQTRKVLHLIGKAVNTSAGLRLEITPISLVRTAVLQATASAPHASSLSPPQRESSYLFGTEDLPLDTSQFVIVQAEPVELTERSQTEREQAAALRAFAADVFAAGARCVLMLPALPQDAGIAVLRAFAADMNSPTLFFQMVEKMRRIILDWRAPNASPDVKAPPSRKHASPDAGAAAIVAVDGLDETRLELALDLCVFFRKP